MTIEQRLDLEREDYRHESTQARLGSRGKFNFCHWCGREDGMESVHRETLEEMPRTSHGGEILATWYKEYANGEYLFHPCLSCNRDKVIPTGFVSMTTDEVLDWLNADPIQQEIQDNE